METRVPRFVALLMLTLGSVLGSAAPAHAACNEPERSFPAQLRDADSVFSGTVTQVVGDRTDPDERLVYVVNVKRVYQGRIAGETTVRSPSTAADCGLRNIQKGERYVFLAGSANDGGVVDAFSNEGTRPQRPAVMDTVTRVLGQGEPPMAPTQAEIERDREASLTQLDDSTAPGLATTSLPGVGLAVLGLLVLGMARVLGRRRG
ncbi:hypothetical protein [Nocardioides donggukensis]|uniref:Netrin module non-TIMP type domain-containing protein n=1 Tax=Nocardioides donggukensis TaxID=2774019 RepID=A0A927Q072_9ACTN|nr:hypothetical protein [Nocardioides donggukensis]MBD8868109.1 hypothetical protein [Nocardioides donggukensis]